MKFDCLLIGHNERDVNEIHSQLKAMGMNHVDFKNMDRNLIEYNNKIYSVLGIINEFRYDKNEVGYRRFYNSDLLSNTILYLGSYLAKKNITFDYINSFDSQKEELGKKLISNQYLFIAITTTHYTIAEPVIEIIEFIKKHSNAQIIVGGPLINKQTQAMSPQEKITFFDYLDADFYIISREGEKALSLLIEASKKGLTFEGIHNLAYKENGIFKINDSEIENNDLEDTPIDYSLFNVADFNESVNIRISKGCLYNCAFCGFPKRSYSFKYMPVELIIKEMDKIENLGIKNLFFIGDTVNVPKQHFKELMKRMVDKKYSFKWNCYFRCDQSDEELIELMSKANCEGVFLGLESSDISILENMNKTSRPEHFVSTIPIFKKYGINVFVSILSGFPGETYDTYRNTIEFLKSIDADFYKPQLWYCDPVTPIWQQKDKYDLVGRNYAWKHLTMTAIEANNLNEWAFLYLDNPIWTPDPGFNFVSFYYLKLRGYTIDETKMILKCYNTIVKQKILHISQNKIDNSLFKNLEYACNRQLENIDNQIIEKYSGESYKRTEQYIMDEFKMESINYFSLNLPDNITSNEYKTSVEINERFHDYWSAYYHFISLVTYVYSNINKSDKNINIIGRNKHGIVPFQLESHMIKDSFDKLSEVIKTKLTNEQNYNTFGLHILTHNKQYHSGNLNIDLVFVEQEDFERFEKVYNFCLQFLIRKKINANGKMSFEINIVFDPTKISKELINTFDNLLQNQHDNLNFIQKQINEFNENKKNRNQGMLNESFNFEI